MSLRRLAAIVLSAAAALLVAVVLYLAFGDLSRHKGRIEALVTELLGRPFAIDGAFELQVLPSISVVAERVRLGNADWGSQPQMVEIGRVSVRIGLWSLVSGPVDVRSFELSDVSVLLETNADGKGNWVFGEARAPAEVAEPPAESAAAVPPVIQSGKLGNVRITYRERGKPDRVALIETLSIGPGSDGLLAISGKGSLNEFPAAVSGELGPLDALFSGRNIRTAIQAAVGDLQVDVKGGLGRLDPLDGADLAVKLAHPDIGAMLKKLHLPVVVSRPSERRCAADGRRRPHPARPRRQARRHHGQGRGHAPRARPARIGPADRSLGGGCRPPGGGVRRDRFAGRRPRGRRPPCLLAHGNQTRRGEREIRRRERAGERNSPPGPRTERRPALRARRREPGAGCGRGCRRSHCP